jgi:hypothetical protein
MGKQWSQIRSPFSFALTTNPHTYHAKSTADGGVLGGRSNGSLLGIDSVVNWSSYFYLFRLDSNGFPQFRQATLPTASARGAMC